MNNIKIGVKLIGGFVIVALIALAIGIYGITNIKTADSRDTILFEKATMPFEHVVDMVSKFQRARVNFRDLLRATTEDKIEYFTDRSNNLIDTLKIDGDKYEKTLVTEVGKKTYAEYNTKLTQFVEMSKKLESLAKNKDKTAAYALLDGDLAAISKDVQLQLETITDQKIGVARKMSDENTKQANTTTSVMLVTLLIGVLIALAIGIFLSMSITGPLQKGVAMMLEMAKGHLGTRLKMKRKDEIGQLANAMDEFSDDLQKNLVATVVKIGEGDVSTDMKPKDNQDEITPAIMNTTIALRGLIAEAGMLRKAAVDGKLATRGKADQFKGGYKDIVEGVNDCLDAVIGPLNVAAEYVDRISKGDIPPAITDNYNGDFNEIKNNLNRCIAAVNALVADAGILAKAAVDGKLATRADASKHEGDFRKIVQGVDDCLDSVIGPLNVAAEYVDRISKGDIPPKISDTYNGDFNEIKNNLNRCIDAVNALVADAGTLAKAAVEGKLATRADASKHEGDFRKIVQGVNDCLDSVIGPLNVAAEYVDRISKGDIPPAITDTYNGDFNEIKNNLNRCITAVNALVTDAGILAKAAVDGKLATRADASKHEGDFRKIVQGVDDCLDAVIGPLNVAAEYVDRISKGDIPPKISDTYNGDFNEIKNNLNQCIDAVNALVADAGLLSKAAVEGKLATRADASKHGGDFAKIVKGVNDCLDSVIGPLNVAAKYVDDISKGNLPPKITDAYNGDFNTIKNNLNTCIDAVNLLVKDANMLAQAGVEGQLQTRADASKHNGDFKRIVEGVNMTLDAVIVPINEAQDVLEKVAARDMKVRVMGDYKGDLAKIKSAINTAVDNLDQALTQVAEATEQVSSGSQQISAGAQSLAQGANEQASSLEEVSSSLEEMSSMTKQNAENANQAKTLAGEANENAGIGTEAMNRMSQSINKIKESSDQTAKIVKTIDEIAIQTNLLALNAAVEAARAGEAGRGFAVVAEEVRNLAQRSSQAAKNTADMISESVKNAEEGVKISVEVSKSFDSIAGSAKKVNDLIAEIAAASQEQSQGIDQVNTAVAQMDKVTQQNAANSEESASAAEEMSSQAEELQSMIGQFALTQSVQKKSTVPVHHLGMSSSIAVKSDKVQHRPSLVAHGKVDGNGNGNGKKTFVKATAIKKVNPEDVIPMDEEVLKEF